MIRLGLGKEIDTLLKNAARTPPPP